MYPIAESQKTNQLKTGKKKVVANSLCWDSMGEIISFLPSHSRKIIENLLLVSSSLKSFIETNTSWMCNQIEFNIDFRGCKRIFEGKKKILHVSNLNFCVSDIALYYFESCSSKEILERIKEIFPNTTRLTFPYEANDNIYKPQLFFEVFPNLNGIEIKVIRDDTFVLFKKGENEKSINLNRELRVIGLQWRPKKKEFFFENKNQLNNLAGQVGPEVPDIRTTKFQIKIENKSIFRKLVDSKLFPKLKKLSFSLGMIGLRQSEEGYLQNFQNYFAFENKNIKILELPDTLIYIDMLLHIIFSFKQLKDLTIGGIFDRFPYTDLESTVFRSIKKGESQIQRFHVGSTQLFGNDSVFYSIVSNLKKLKLFSIEIDEKNGIHPLLKTQVSNFTFGNGVFNAKDMNTFLKNNPKCRKLCFSQLKNFDSRKHFEEYNNKLERNKKLEKLEIYQSIYPNIKKEHLKDHFKNGISIECIELLFSAYPNLKKLKTKTIITSKNKKSMKKVNEMVAKGILRFEFLYNCLFNPTKRKRTEMWDLRTIENNILS